MFAEGLSDWISGRDTDGAEAAALNVADILLVFRERLIKGWNQ